MLLLRIARSARREPVGVRVRFELPLPLELREVLSRELREERDEGLKWIGSGKEDAVDLLS